MTARGGARGLVGPIGLFQIILAPEAYAQVPFRVGTFAQGRAVAGPGDDGFVVTHARLRGEWDVRRTVEMVVQGEFAGTPQLLDARLRWQPTRALRLDAGAFKPPFSRNFLTSRGDLLRDDRMRVVQRLGPGRQVGLAAALTPPGTATTLHVGLVNGNGVRTPEPDSGGVKAVGRVEQRVRLGAATLELGTHAATGRDGAVSLPEGRGLFAGRRTLVGGDVHVEAGRLTFDVEGLWARLRREGESEALRPWGVGATAAWRLRRNVWAVAAYDRLAGDTLATGHWGGASLRITVAPGLAVHAGVSTALNRREPVVARLTGQITLR